MDTPEITILILNVIAVFIAYFIVYPRLCGSNGVKIANNDLMASGLVLLVAGSMYWGAEIEFNLLFVSVNWFWFTLLTYAAIEIPIMLWYFKKNSVWESFEN